MPGTLRLHIDDFNETAKTWLDTSGNEFDAIAVNAPALTTQNGLAAAEFVKAQGDKFVTEVLPPPTNSATFLFVGYLPPAGNLQYDGLMILRNGYAVGLGCGLFINPSGGVTYLWGSIFNFAGVSRSNELALYAVTVAPSGAMVYRIDSTGTIVASNATAHESLSFTQNRSLYLGDDNTSEARNTNFKARFFEYYRNQVLTQSELESIYQVVVSDNVRPSDVTGLVADANRNITSNEATDNNAVTGYRTERRINGGAWTLLTPTSRNFQDNENLPTEPNTYLFEYRRKAYDAKNNESLNWSNIASAILVITPAPIITNKPQLLWAQTGKTYEVQFKVAGGSGSGSWSLANAGNLPNDRFFAGGVLIIPTVGSTNYNFTVRFTDADGRNVQKDFTIPVSPLAFFKWQYQRPLQITHVKKQRIFEPLEGDEEIIEDAPTKLEFDVTAILYGSTKINEFKAFLAEHGRREKFLFPRTGGAILVCKIIDAPEEAEILAHVETVRIKVREA